MWGRFTLSILILSCVLSTGASAGEGSVGKPFLMGSLGDSITAGTFADSELPADFLIAQTNQVQAHYQNKDTLSWASGREIQSQFVLLSAYLSKTQGGANLEVLNEAIPGKTSADIEAQAQHLVDAMKSGKYAALKYVTLLVGANDVCSKTGVEDTTPDQMLANLDKAFAKLAEIEQAEPIHVLVSSIRKIPELGVPEIRNHPVYLGAKCSTLRGTLFSGCNNLTGWKTETQYLANVGKVAARNDVLQAAVQGANRVYPAKIQAFYSGSVFQTQLPASVLAWDCFHPNRTGQEGLSLRVWQDQPFFK